MRTSSRLRLARPLRSLVSLLLLVLLPVASAGSPDDPEVVDAAGDAGPASTPSPAGFEWADITALWFDEGDAGDAGAAGSGTGPVALTVEVVRLDADPPGEVGAHFRVGDTWWIAGWTTILFPAPPFSYAGGFSCVADAAGGVPDTSLCGSLEASHDGTRFTVALPRDLFGLAPGSAIEEPRGYAVDAVSAQPGLGQGWVEQTAVGRSFTLVGSPAAAGAAPASPGAATPAGQPAAAGGQSAEPAAEAGSAAAPAPAWAVVALGVVALAAARRR